MKMTPVTVTEIEQIKARQAKWAECGDGVDGAVDEFPNDHLKEQLISYDLSRVCDAYLSLLGGLAAEAAQIKRTSEDRT